MSEDQRAEWSIVRERLESGHYVQEEVFRCFFCGSQDAVLVAEKDRYGNKLDSVVCKECGIIRSLHQMDADTLSKFYGLHYRKAHGDEPTIENFMQRMEAATGRRDRWQRDLGLLGLEPTTTTVFEIGCGAGWNLLPLQLVGAQVGGCDQGPAYKEVAATYGIDLFEGDVDDYLDSHATPQFDLLLLMEVLEHSPNPSEMLAKVNRMLRPGGYLMISVPPLTAGYCYWYGDLMATLQMAHNYLFDFESLSLVASSAGFTTIRGNRLISDALYRKTGAPTSDRWPGKTKVRGRGMRVLRYLKLMEWLAYPYWRAWRRLLLDRRDERLRWKVIMFHLRWSAPDLMRANLRGVAGRWKRRVSRLAST